MKSLIAWLAVYRENPDKRAAACNLIALLIVSNQPFYPLYVYAVAGNGASVTLVSFLSTPFFFAVPAMSRRNALAGRIFLCVVGTLNTALCMWAFGETTGVALFFLPCIMLGALLFRNTEISAMAACTLLPMGAFVLLHNRLGAPLHVFSATEYSALVTLHAFSVGALTAVIGYVFSSRLGTAT